jgi:hypothetical protein
VGTSAKIPVHSVILNDSKNDENDVLRFFQQKNIEFHCLLVLTGNPVYTIFEFNVYRGLFSG